MRCVFVVVCCHGYSLPPQLQTSLAQAESKVASSKTEIVRIKSELDPIDVSCIPTCIVAERPRSEKNTTSQI